MEEPMYLGGLGALALLVIGGVLVAVRKIREKRLGGFDSGMMSSGDLGGPAEKVGAAASDTSFLTDFSQAGLGTIDTNEVDPIAEADVYMAYGRDGQAEEILKEAMTKEPHRYEIHLKLLEIYAGRKNVSAFETLATELYAALDGQHSPIWDKAAQMGRILDPGNPLYGTAPAAEEDMEKTMVLSPEKMESLKEATPEAEAGLADLDFDLATGAASAEEEQSSTLDIDLGETPAASEDEMLDVSMPGDEALDLVLGEAVEEPAVELEAPHEEESGLDFILEEPIAAEAPAAAPEAKAEAVAMPDTDALDFDFEAMSAPEPVAEEAPVHEETAAETGMEDILEMAELAEPAPAEEALLEMPGPAEAAPEMPAPEAPAPAAEAGKEAAEEEPLTELDTDFDTSVLDELAAEAPVAEPAAEEFEVADMALPEAEETIVAAPPPAEEADMSALDFDFNLEEPAAGDKEPAQAPAPAAVPDVDLSGISLDLDETPAAPAAAPDLAAEVDDSRWQEAATKLDLAKAYMEMGDREGAREILQEVLSEGNDQQQGEAQSMLAELA
jgi:pilus assembly protein FimV